MPTKQKPSRLPAAEPPPQFKNAKSTADVGDFDVDDYMSETDPKRKKAMFESGAVSPSYLDMALMGGGAQALRGIGSKVLPAVGGAISRFLSKPPVQTTLPMVGAAADMTNVEEGMPVGLTHSPSKFSDKLAGEGSALDALKGFEAKKPLPPVPNAGSGVELSVPPVGSPTNIDNIIFDDIQNKTKKNIATVEKTKATPKKQPKPVKETPKTGNEIGEKFSEKLLRLREKKKPE